MTMRFVVYGRVQGVGFRYFVRAEAKSSGVYGEVWNRADGGVEIIAISSNTEVLANFHERLRHGPGKPSQITVEVVQDVEANDFVIGPSR